MAVCQLQSAHVVALEHPEMRGFRVLHAAKLFAELLARGREFWRRNVVAKEPPLADSTPAHADYLAEAFWRKIWCSGNCPKLQRRF